MKVTELEFKEHPAKIGGTQARVTFKNGYGASIITGQMFYSKPHCPYELAVLKNDHLHYDNPVAEGDVCGYLTEDDVNKLLEEIENFDENTESKYVATKTTDFEYDKDKI